MDGQDETNFWEIKSDQSVAKAETVRVLIEHGADVACKMRPYRRPCIWHPTGEVLKPCGYCSNMVRTSPHKIETIGPLCTWRHRG